MLRMQQTAQFGQHAGNECQHPHGRAGNTVGNLDQYQKVSSTAITFAAGTTASADRQVGSGSVATTLAGEKGYIIEVQGYSRSGVQTSQAMADSVVRYLVTEHQVPVYRIYRSGLGKNTAKAGDGEQAVANGVRVTLLHNSLATMGSSASNSAAPKTSPSTGVSAPHEVNNQCPPQGGMELYTVRKFAEIAT